MLCQKDMLQQLLNLYLCFVVHEVMVNILQQICGATHNEQLSIVCAISFGSW